MKYITSCPKCETHFLLNDALIEAHRGKVQCGTCEHVFNAKTRLTEVPDDINSADEYQASLEGAQQPEVEETTLAKTSEKSSSDLFADEFTDIKVDNEPTFEVKTSSNTIPLDDTPSIFDDLNKNTKTAPKKSKHPILFSLFGLLLLLMAAAQTIYHMRVSIAAEYPQFKPLLVKACSYLHCNVSLPKDLDSITIGDSDMQENDSYESVINFTSSLTNTATYPLAYPSIALTLTNESDKVVIKKLISPEEYLPADKKVEDGIEARGMSTVKLQLYVHEATVAGYRILLVYP